jgi:ribonuclease P protein component
VLATHHRLRDTDAFRRTVRSGRRAGGAALVVHLLVDGSGPADPPRVGFVVTKAVGGSVERNRVRRRLRHLVRERLTDLPPASELVVRALPPAATASSAELGIELSRCLQRVVAASRATPATAGAGVGARAGARAES